MSIALGRWVTQLKIHCITSFPNLVSIFFSVSLNVKFSFDLIFLIEISYVAILICQSRILLFPTKILYNKLFRYLNFVKIYLQFVPTLKGKRSTQTFNLACTVLKRFLLLKFPDWKSCFHVIVPLHQITFCFFSCHFYSWIVKAVEENKMISWHFSRDDLIF